jgi:hypothetical protein
VDGWDEFASSVMDWLLGWRNTSRHSFGIKTIRKPRPITRSMATGFVTLRDDPAYQSYGSACQDRGKDDWNGQSIEFTITSDFHFFDAKGAL